MKYHKIHETSLEKGYYENEERRRNWIIANRPAEEVAQHDKRMKEVEQKRDAIKAKFPYSVVLEGSYPEHDYVGKWCWDNIGPMDCEKCPEKYSEFIGCPLILASPKLRKEVHYTDQDGKKHSWEEEYYDVPDHGHEGPWTSLWLAKTGYDYGHMEYSFQNESDRDRFLAAVPTLDPWRDEKEGDK